MILDEIVTTLRRVLLTYRDHNPLNQIVVPEPGEEDAALLAVPADARVKEVIQLAKSIHAIYLPFKSYIKHIESIKISPSIRGVSKLKDEITKAIEAVYEKRSQQYKIAEKLKTEYFKEKSERKDLILKYCRAKHKFCTAYLKKEFKSEEKLEKSEEKLEEFAENYGALMLANKYLNQKLVVPPKLTAYEGEFAYLKLGKEIYEMKTLNIDSFFAYQDPEGNVRHLNYVSAEIESEIAHKALGFDFYEGGLNAGSAEICPSSSPSPSIPRP